MDKVSEIVKIGLEVLQIYKDFAVKDLFAGLEWSDMPVGLRSVLGRFS